MNPRAAVNDLLPFQGSPFGQLGYFSKLSYMLSSVCQKRYLLYNIFFHFVKHYFKLFLQVFICLTNGESGIRTHAPLRTNGFQDRLVMTTSIPLHDSLFSCRFLSDIGYFITREFLSQYKILSFLVFPVKAPGNTFLQRLLRSPGLPEL